MYMFFFTFHCFYNYNIIIITIILYYYIILLYMLYNIRKTNIYIEIYISKNIYKIYRY